MLDKTLPARSLRRLPWKTKGFSQTLCFPPTGPQMSPFPAPSSELQSYCKQQRNMGKALRGDRVLLGVRPEADSRDAGTAEAWAHTHRELPAHEKDPHMDTQHRAGSVRRLGRRAWAATGGDITWSWRTNRHARGEGTSGRKTHWRVHPGTCVASTQLVAVLLFIFKFRNLFCLIHKLYIALVKNKQKQKKPTMKKTRK